MRRVAIISVLLSQLASCMTYTINSDNRSGGTIGVLLGVEIAAGAGVAFAGAESKNKIVWYENVAYGMLVVFGLDLLIGLGVKTADYVGD